jgi:hypothetical protein
VITLRGDVSVDRSPAAKRRRVSPAATAIASTSLRPAPVGLAVTTKRYDTYRFLKKFVDVHQTYS